MKRGVFTKEVVNWATSHREDVEYLEITDTADRQSVHFRLWYVNDIAPYVFDIVNVPPLDNPDAVNLLMVAFPFKGRAGIVLDLAREKNVPGIGTVAEAFDSAMTVIQGDYRVIMAGSNSCPECLEEVVFGESHKNSHIFHGKDAEAAKERVNKAMDLFLAHRD